MADLASAAERAKKSLRDKTEVNAIAFGPVNQERILQLIGLNPRDPKAHAVVAVARRYDLDPVLGHIAIIAQSQMPYITRDGYLHIAHRSQQLDGMEIIDGPRREGSEWVARVAVYRKDMSHAFVYPGRADVAAHNGPEMAVTRAERRALRRAFAVTLPAEFGSDDGVQTVPLRALSATEGDDHPPAGSPVPPAVSDDGSAPLELSAQQRKKIFAEWSRLGLSGADDTAHEVRLALYQRVLGRDIGSTRELSDDDASKVISTLANVYPNEPVTAEMTQRLIETIGIDTERTADDTTDTTTDTSTNGGMGGAPE